jgi:hypothetical protein
MTVCGVIVTRVVGRSPYVAVVAAGR